MTLPKFNSANNKLGASPWIMWGLTAFFYFYEYFLQVSPGVMVPELMQAFSVDATALGSLAASYFYIYAPMQIPVGVLLDRYGPRRLTTIAATLCALGCFLFGTAKILGIAQLGRLFIGFGSAFAVVSCLSIAAAWFPTKRFALLTGLMVTIGMLGAIGAETPLALLVPTAGWRASMLILALVGAGLALLMWLFVRDKPRNSDIHVKQKSIFSGLSHIIKQKQNWLVALYGGLVYAPTSIFCVLWGVPFLMATYHLGRPVAAGIISMSFIGWVVGSPIGGWYSDFIGKRLPPLYMASVGAFLSLTLLIYAHDLTLWQLNALLFAFGFFSSGFLPAFSIIREINPPSINATALGFMNMLNMVGGAAGQPLVGFLLDLFWQGNMENGTRIYSATNFHDALTALPVMLALSCFIIPCIRETYCKATEEA